MARGWLARRSCWRTLPPSAVRRTSRGPSTPRRSPNLLAADLDRAEAGALRALGLATEVGEIPVVWRAHAVLARARAAQGRLEASGPALERARRS